MGRRLALDGPLITSQAPQTVCTPHAFAAEEAQSVMARYMRDVRRYPLLTPEQEKRLAQQIDDGRRQ
jgi:DNA-directed RNA polymerase sigma subunit (sigma70/sigma32)